MNNTETGITLNTQSFLELSKEAIRDKAMAVVDNYRDGYNNPAEGLLISKKLIDFAEMIKENLADAAANELKLASGEKRVINGASFNEQMTGVRYDFSHCEDKLYNEAMAIVKEREAFLKTVKGTAMTGDLSTGETWMVNEPIKSGKLSLIIKY